MTKHEVDEIERELEQWTGITGHYFDRKRRHIRLTVATDNGSRFITMSKTTSDARAARNRIGDIRRALRELGAQKGN